MMLFDLDLPDKDVHESENTNKITDKKRIIEKHITDISENGEITNPHGVEDVVEGNPHEVEIKSKDHVDVHGKVHAKNANGDQIIDMNP
jgi:hypothetical protein